MNAIERLREYVNEWFYSPEGLPVSSEHESVLADVAAVDALYQSAKELTAVNANRSMPISEWTRSSIEANSRLAAAVRRVEGD